MNLEHLEGGSIRRTDDPGEPQTGIPRISIAEEEARILAHMATGKYVFEIGTGLGVSTRAMAATATWIYTHDIDPWVHDTIWPTLPYNVTGITTIDQLEYHPGLVFIDGDHNTDKVKADIDLAHSVCEPGAMIVCHDTNYPNVAEALTGSNWNHINTTHGLSWKEI